ncbi:MAG TPA: TfuA-like protein [Falsiroseomonas sp.]|jgi:hypothetical protein|nr:TfuA-like protein [Falsiroseomonas sp.]
MSHVVIFAGPSIPLAEARAILPADYRPPAMLGDLCRAALEAPRAIGLIDGLFGSVPAVWHKEVLWALSRGIHVFGASSMGALRAAELHGFGMVGVGAVFKAFRDGVLEADDEVAVLHGPAEAGFPACSEALVNIRATLEAAEAAGVIGAAEAAALLDTARALHFADRDWPRLLEEAEAVPAAAREALREWLPAGRMDRKRTDARAMLEVMACILAHDPAPLRVHWAFAWTDKWDDLFVRCEAAAGARTALDLAVLEEARLDAPGRHAQLHAAALLRAMAEREALRQGLPSPSPRQLVATAEAFRRERGLLGRAETEAWLVEVELDPASFAAFLEDEARLRWFLSAARGPATAQLLNQLRADGDYARLHAQAAAKRRTLAATGLDAPDPRDLLPGPEGLTAWFIRRKGLDPARLPAVDPAAAFGFEDAEDFLRALAREWVHAGPGPR